MKNKSARYIISVVLCVIGVHFFPAYAAAVNTQSGAVIVMFHRFGQNTHPSTNVTLQQLNTFVSYIQNNGFSVRPLSQVVTAVQNGDSVPAKTVVITIDDAYKSIYTYAYPLFKRAGFPFTVFLSSREIGGKNFLSWQQVSEMAADGVEFQAHTHTHAHMPQRTTEQNIADIDTNVKLIEKYTGIKPTLFAYPYGEASTDTIDTVKNMGFRAGFSQHSGVFTPTGDMFYIPRFSLNEKYATTERIKLVLNARPFAVTAFSPNNPHIDKNNPPVIHFSVPESLKSVHNINCFYNGVAKMTTNKTYPTVTLTFDQPFGSGRHRINCTARHPDGRGYRWLGMQYVVTP